MKDNKYKLWKSYNYTCNIRCNDMKPIERKFFRYMIRQIDYTSINTYYSARLIKQVQSLSNYFAEKYNVPYNQLMYYLEKWTRRGFYNYGTALDCGWFENINKLIDGEIKNYSEAVPARVRSKVHRRTWR